MDEPATNGAWSRRGLPQGSYTLMILVNRANVWYRQELALEGDETLDISIPTLHVSGSVLVGGQALRGTLQLRDGATGAARDFPLDESGAFAGQFPAARATGIKWSANISSKSPFFRRQIQRIDHQVVSESEVTFAVKLSAGRLEGTVVDEQSAPVARAYVSAQMNDTSSGDGNVAVSESNAVADDRGRFQMLGLDPGDYRVFAEGPDNSTLGVSRTSETHDVSVDENGEKGDGIKLVLRPVRKIRGRLTNTRGNAVAGASIILSSRERPEVLVRPQSTDANGVFEGVVTHDTRTVVLSVSQIGVSRTITAATISDETLEMIVNEESGRLVVTLGNSGLDPTSFFVARNGGWENLAALAQWGSLNGERSDPLRVSAPLMSPGKYTVCHLMSLAEYGAFLARTLPKGRCASGVLDPGGELALNFGGS